MAQTAQEHAAQPKDLFNLHPASFFENKPPHFLLFETPPRSRLKSQLRLIIRLLLRAVPSSIRAQITARLILRLLLRALLIRSVLILFLYLALVIRLLLLARRTPSIQYNGLVLGFLEIVARQHVSVVDVFGTRFASNCGTLVFAELEGGGEEFAHLCFICLYTCR